MVDLVGHRCFPHVIINNEAQFVRDKPRTRRRLQPWPHVIQIQRTRSEGREYTYLPECLGPHSPPLPPSSMAPNAQYRKKFHSDRLLTDSVNTVTFSPDGKLVVAADSRGVLLTMDVRLGAVLHLAYLAPLVQVYSLTWTPENELFFGCSNGAVGALALQNINDEVGATACIIECRSFSSYSTTLSRSRTLFPKVSPDV